MTWDKFWGKRQVALKSGQLEKFYNNYRIFAEMVKRSWGGESLFREARSLEVGCGRGTLSDFFKTYGWDTFRSDIADHQLKDAGDHFSIVDVFELENFYGRRKFDVVFSYGLLEHFKLTGQVEMLDQIGRVTTTNGISIHYVVPSKLTNLNEDRSVYRDDCHALIDIIGEDKIKWVFPAMGIGQWETNKFLGKGFIFGLAE